METPKKEPKKRGPKPVMTEEKDRQLRALCRMKPSLDDCAAMLDVSTRSIERHIRNKYDLKFGEFREQNMAWSRHMVFREILEGCKKGNPALLIWASKNLLGWTDKYESNVSGEVSHSLTYEKDE